MKIHIYIYIYIYIYSSCHNYPGGGEPCAEKLWPPPWVKGTCCIQFPPPGVNVQKRLTHPPGPHGDSPWEFPMGNSPWGIPESPMGNSEIPHGDFPMGNSPWGIPHGNSPWGIPHEEFPMGDPPWGIPHGEFPMGNSP